MSKKKHKNKNIQEPKRMSAQDSFQNQLARMGVGTDNLMNGTEYPMTRLTRNYQLMNSLYRNSWIAKKVINTIPEDMCKNWFSIAAELAPDIQDRYNRLEELTKLREKILEGLYWGRLYGGAGAIMLIDGHEDRLEEPLRYDDIMPNSFRGLMIVDRWSGIYPSSELITDINEPDFGLPEFYEIRDVHGVMRAKVHHTRVVRFIGRKLPFFEDIVEIHWGAAELEHVFDELQKRDNTSWNIASLVFQANLLVNKVDGLDQLVALGDGQAQQDFYNIKKAQNIMRNNSSMFVVGKEESIESFQYTFAGLSDIYNDFMLDISGACDIPVTKLFGRSPAGMNATGESDENNYYDMIGQQQESVLKPKIMKILPVMFMSEFGKIPDDLSIKFNPARTPSDEKMAELIGKKVTAIKDVYDVGIINQKMALMELHELSYTSNMFSSITEEDIEAADTNFHDENLLSDMLGDEGDGN
jgi:phage-related protein (TIGR01555 family)